MHELESYCLIQEWKLNPSKAWHDLKQQMIAENPNPISKKTNMKQIAVKKGKASIEEESEEVSPLPRNQIKRNISSLGDFSEA
jgi:hypothetical protein